MKAKMKFDTAAIKNFFSEHVEKIVVGVCVIVLCVFIKSIFSRETLPSNLQPTQISKKTESTVRQYEESPFKSTKDIAPLPVPNAVAPVPSTILGEAPPVVQSAVLRAAEKRVDPMLYTPIGLQATGLLGALVTANGGVGVTLPVVVPATRGPAIDASRPSGPTNPAAPAPRSGRGGRQPLPAANPTGRPALPATAPAAGEAVAQPIPPDFEQPGAVTTGSAEFRAMVIITGAIPVEMQQKEFDLRFSHALRVETDPNGSSGRPGFQRSQQSDRDVPRYIYWRLERKDMTTGGEPVVIDYGDGPQIIRDREDESIGKAVAMLKPKTFKKIDKEIGTWGAIGAEVVPKEFMDAPWLTWPLPGLLLHQWGREATNPKIPLTYQAVADPGATSTPGDATKPSEADPFSADASAPPGNAAQAVSPRPMAAPQPSGPYAGRTRVHGNLDPSRPSNGPYGRDRSAPSGRSFVGPQNAGRDNNEGPQVPYKLFRFIDFDVEPGHSYQYRVQLVLKNPNFGIPAEYLKTPEPKPLPYRDTPWSEPSNVATVPLDAQLVADSVERPRRGEPKAKGGVLMWEKKEAVQLLLKTDLGFGDIVNFLQKKVVAVADPVTRTIRDITADFVTDGALLDMHGGGDLVTSVDSGGPGEMLFLVLGRDGKPDQLTVVTQAGDQQAVDFWDKTHKVPAEMLQPADATTPSLIPRGRVAPHDASAPSAAPAGGGLLPSAKGTGAGTPKQTPPRTGR